MIMIQFVYTTARGLQGTPGCGYINHLHAARSPQQGFWALPWPLAQIALTITVSNASKQPAHAVILLLLYMCANRAWNN